MYLLLCANKACNRSLLRVVLVLFLFYESIRYCIYLKMMCRIGITLRSCVRLRKSKKIIIFRNSFDALSCTHYLEVVGSSCARTTLPPVNYLGFLLGDVNNGWCYPITVQYLPMPLIFGICTELCMMSFEILPSINYDIFWLWIFDNSKYA